MNQTLTVALRQFTPIRHTTQDRELYPWRELYSFNSRLAPAGALICFDIGFPEAARTLAPGSAELIVAPSALHHSFKDINR